MYKEYGKLNRKSKHIEKRYDALVEELKGKICRGIFVDQEKEFLEAEGMRKEVDRELGNCSKNPKTLKNNTSPCGTSNNINNVTQGTQSHTTVQGQK